MKPSRHLLRLALSLCALSLPAHADLFVVVNAANPIHSMSKHEVAALYLGRSHAFASGEFALTFDHPRDSPVRERFFRQVVGMSLGQVNTYWSRLMFAGQEIPPQQLPGEQAVMDIVRRNPGAIGYVATPPKEGTVRVVLEIRE